MVFGVAKKERELAILLQSLLLVKAFRRSVVKNGFPAPPMWISFYQDKASEQRILRNLLQRVFLVKGFRISFFQKRIFYASNADFLLPWSVTCWSWSVSRRLFLLKASIPPHTAQYHKIRMGELKNGPDKTTAKCAKKLKIPKIFVIQNERGNEAKKS